MGSKFMQKFNRGLVIFFLVIICLVVLYPLVYVASAAVNPGSSVANLSIIPFQHVTFSHFVDLFTNPAYNYGRWFLNTLIVASATSASTLLVASLSAYAFSRFHFSFKKPLMLALLILQVFPSIVAMIAIYMILYRFGLLDNLWGLVLIYLAGNIPYNVWMVKSYMDTIPRSLDEAARIDGAGNFRIWATIVMPMAKPILTFLALTSFTAPWMEYIFSKLVLRSNSNFTLALGLYTFVTDKVNKFTTFAAGAIIIAIPFIIFFVLTQKMLVTSLGGAAVKE